MTCRNKLERISRGTLQHNRYYVVEANTAFKDEGKAERKAVTQKKAMTGKEKKPSIHERLEINKRIIQEKQGRDKPERRADLGVRTV